MQIINNKGFYYLFHSFRKNGQVVSRKKYLGKEIPVDIESIKIKFLQKCLKEDVFIKLDSIKKNFNRDWKKLPESIKKKNLIDLSVAFTYSTNAIEGSTITLEETDELIKKRISPNKPIDDVKETLSHSKLFLEVINSRSEFDLKTIKKWHKALFFETKPDIAGLIREYSVKVGNYRAPDWQDLKKLLKDYFDWIEQNNATMHAVEFAARAHHKFEKIHPFGDGNGRIGRLIIALILRKYKYPIMIIPYKKRRTYYHALEKDENGFLLYFVRRYIAEFKDYI
ncbi:MAG: Fic family protein [Nanoarchaeota archaeon]|nr:Fic family protein [Nanoarchaeota archaeon]